jgi:hypothetical protein
MNTSTSKFYYYLLFHQLGCQEISSVYYCAFLIMSLCVKSREINGFGWLEVFVVLIENRLASPVSAF